MSFDHCRSWPASIAQPPGAVRRGIAAAAGCSGNLEVDRYGRRVPSAAQPNIVFIMSDDQDIATMQYMPRVQELLAAQGVTFENSFVTSPHLLPVQRHHADRTVHLQPRGAQQLLPDRRVPEVRGHAHRRRPGHARRRVHPATWLDDAGYNTARVGKYLVEYPERLDLRPAGVGRVVQHLRRRHELLQLPHEREWHGGPVRQPTRKITSPTC